MDKEVRDRKIAKMAATGMSLRKISKELEKGGEKLSHTVVGDILQKPEVKEIIEKEKNRLAQIIPQCVTNYEYWVKNAKMFHDPKAQEIGFRATTKVLESHGLVSGAPSVQVKITISQTEVTVSPVIQRMLENFMGKLDEAQPVKPEAIEVDYEVIPGGQTPDVRTD
jgi:hypothetical protein